MSRIVIKHATILDFMESKVVPDVDIIIDNDTISCIGKSCGENIEAQKIIDASNHYVYPGMVCSHHHYYSGLSRGILAQIGPTPDFISILKELWWKLDRALDEESVYYSSIICSLDAIAAGTTSVIDHHASPNFISGSLKTIAKGMLYTGLRGMTCYEMTDRNFGTRELEQGADENIAFAAYVDSLKEQGVNTIEAAIGGHAPFTISNTGLQLMAEAIEETSRGIHLHVAEDSYDVTHSHHIYGQDIVNRLESFNLLNDKTILVHGLSLTENEINILNSYDGFLAHNARSNMNNSVGYIKNIPIVKNLVIGTDGIGADMFEEFKFAYFKHKDASGSFWPDTYLSALMRGNNLLERYFNHSFGRIDAGYKADLVISDYRSPTPLTGENLAGHLAFGMSSNNVRTVVINGRVVMENREFPMDVQSLYKEASKSAHNVWKRFSNL